MLIAKVIKTAILMSVSSLGDCEMTKPENSSQTMDGQRLTRAQELMENPVPVKEKTDGQVGVSDADDSPVEAKSETHKKPKEIGGPDGPDPARFGDWERNGRCIDF